MLIAPLSKAQVSSVDLQIRRVSQDYLDTVKEIEEEYYRTQEVLTDLEHAVYRLSRDTLDSARKSTYVDAKLLLEETTRSLITYKQKIEDIDSIYADYLHVLREILADSTAPASKREFLELSQGALRQDKFTLKVLIREREWVEKQIERYDEVLLVTTQ